MPWAMWPSGHQETKAPVDVICAFRQNVTGANCMDSGLASWNFGNAVGRASLVLSPSLAPLTAVPIRSVGPGATGPHSASHPSSLYWPCNSSFANSITSPYRRRHREPDTPGHAEPALPSAGPGSWPCGASRQHDWQSPSAFPLLLWTRYSSASPSPSALST